MDTRGDDLDDDFVPDDIVAMSEDEDVAHSADGDEIGGLLSADEAGAAEAGPSQSSQAALEKKRKRRQKEKERKAKVSSVWIMRYSLPGLSLKPPAQKAKLAEAMEPAEQPSPAAQPPILLVDYVSSMQAKSFSKMSGIELADIQIPGEYRTFNTRLDSKC